MAVMRRLVRSQYLSLMRVAPSLAPLAFLPMAFRRSLRLRVTGDCIEVSKGLKIVRLARRHQFYLPALLNQFEFYYSAVEADEVCGRQIVDFSMPNFHKVRGYPDQPMQFPGLVEPVRTAELYLELAKLAPGDVVLDLGAYSGFTSILFDQSVGDGGRVVAVDADLNNIECIERNLSAYRERNGRTVDVLHAAVWKDDGEILFSCEANMGSSVAEIVGTWRGNAVKVPAVTLETIADTYGLERIDFIKCDIEGAEAVIFDRPRFFERFCPRIVIEVHKVDEELTTRRCRAALAPFGYNCREVPQTGSDLPLLACLPSHYQ